jgi:hypothetical protein
MEGAGAERACRRHTLRVTGAYETIVTDPPGAT